MYQEMHQLQARLNNLSLQLATEASTQLRHRVRQLKDSLRSAHGQINGQIQALIRMEGIHPQTREKLILMSHRLDALRALGLEIED